MIPTFEPLRQISDGEVLGADTYLNIVAARSNYLYGQAHALNGLQRQPWGSTTGALTVWEADTRRVPEHPTLNFSARINLVAGGSAQLQYYGSDSAWHDMPTNGSDTTLGDRWFCGTENLTYTVSGLSLPDDEILHLRFIIAGGAGLSTATVYRAYLSGSTGLTAWPTMPTFADGMGSVPHASDYNALRSAQDYLYQRALKPNCGSELGKATHLQTGAYEALYRWSFTYSGTQRLYIYLTVTEYVAGAVRVYINDEKFPTTGSRYNGGVPLVEITGEANQGYNFDLSGLGLTKGVRYQIELGIERDGDDGCTVEVGALTLADLGGVTRTYRPKSDWAHGDRPTAAQLNVMKNDIVQMKDDASSESPIWPHHILQPFTVWDELGVFRYSLQKFRITHRWRYLRWRGAGKIVSGDRQYEETLSDTDPAGESQVLDLDSLEWLDYGMDYTVEGYGTNRVLVAYEDYA